MAVFYGVYLAEHPVATILDVIRFIGQPTHLRFSHVTLRGPYLKPLARNELQKINDRVGKKNEVTLLGPNGFFSENQSTVFLRVDLGALADIVHKPDFPNSIPHITVYDGKDHVFASLLIEKIQKYNWQASIPVSEVKKLQKNAPVDELLLKVYQRFFENLMDLFGNEEEIRNIRNYDAQRKIHFISKYLSAVSSEFNFWGHRGRPRLSFRAERQVGVRRLVDPRYWVPPSDDGEH